MNLLYAQYTPFFLAVIAVGLGVIYSNSRITLPSLAIFTGRPSGV